MRCAAWNGSHHCQICSVPHHMLQEVDLHVRTHLITQHWKIQSKQLWYIKKRMSLTKRHMVAHCYVTFCDSNKVLSSTLKSRSFICPLMPRPLICTHWIDDLASHQWNSNIQTSVPLEGNGDHWTETTLENTKSLRKYLQVRNQIVEYISELQCP